MDVTPPAGPRHPAADVECPAVHHGERGAPRAGRAAEGPPVVSGRLSALAGGGPSLALDEAVPAVGRVVEAPEVVVVGLVVAAGRLAPEKEQARAGVGAVAAVVAQAWGVARSGGVVGVQGAGVGPHHRGLGEGSGGAGVRRPAGGGVEDGEAKVVAVGEGAAPDLEGADGEGHGEALVAGDAVAFVDEHGGMLVRRRRGAASTQLRPSAVGARRFSGAGWQRWWGAAGAQEDTLYKTGLLVSALKQLHLLHGILCALELAILRDVEQLRRTRGLRRHRYLIIAIANLFFPLN